MLLPSAYLAYSLYREQQFKKNADIFIDNEFTQKGYTVVYKKTDFNAIPKKIELAFLNKRFEKNEVKSLNKVLNTNKYLKGTDLLIRQDSTDRFSALRGDILRQVQSSENQLNTKDVKILQLEKELNAYRFDNKRMLGEVKILFPEITSLSISSQNMAIVKDSTASFTAAIYESTKALDEDEGKKLAGWLSQRLLAKKVVLFRKEY